MIHEKAAADDMPGRFREIVSDPLNLLIERVPAAGTVDDGDVVLHNGLKVPFKDSTAYYGEFSSILVINRGVHEPLEEFVFQEILRQLPAAPFMLELGAYWGHYSMWLKSVRRHGRVYLVEPARVNLDVGRANFHRNGFDGEFIEAFVAQGQFGVDAFLAEHGIEKLDILHADIQGFELEMLAGASIAFERRQIDRVFVSTHSQLLHEAVIQRLLSHGYRIDIAADFSEQTTAFDGLVLASNPVTPALFAGFAPLGRLEIMHASPRRLVEYAKATMDLFVVPRS